LARSKHIFVEEALGCEGGLAGLDGLAWLLNIC
jgi:hypothetical protein